MARKPTPDVVSKTATMDLRIFTEPQFGASYGDQLAVAQAAEGAGFDAFFRSDHWQAFAGDGLPGPTDSWLTLGAIARETERIRLGTLVSSATFRHPGPLAARRRGHASRRISPSVALPDFRGSSRRIPTAPASKAARRHPGAGRPPLQPTQRGISVPRRARSPTPRPIPASVSFP